MVERSRGLPSADKRELWKRWRAGESLSAIGRALDRTPIAVFKIISRQGGISPAIRVRHRQALTAAEREEISRGLATGRSMREIARGLHRSPATVSREIDRNGGRSGYRAHAAEARAWVQACRPKPCRLACHGSLQRIVAEKLACHWSPAQIAGWLKRAYPGDTSMQVSHETIYRSLFIQARGVLKKELIKHLRTGRLFRHARHHRIPGIVDGLSIRARPAEADDRAVPGHWEGDLLSGSGNTHMATLVERHSRFTLLVKVENKETKTVVDALSRQVRQLPLAMRKSLTWDRGAEMKDHPRFTLATEMAVYLCDPSSPWQRGTNENTNRLLRQYFPKGTDLSQYSQADLNRVAIQLNQRPRKTLGFLTPAEKFRACVAATG